MGFDGAWTNKKKKKIFNVFFSSSCEPADEMFKRRDLLHTVYIFF